MVGITQNNNPKNNPTKLRYSVILGLFQCYFRGISEIFFGVQGLFFGLVLWLFLGLFSGYFWDYFVVIILINSAQCCSI